MLDYIGNLFPKQRQLGRNCTKQIIFSDEAHFHLGGYVNKQNCHIWGSENPHEVLEKPMHPLRVTVWCGLWSGGIIGPYFFEDEGGATVTVNGDTYRTMITDFFMPTLDGIDAVHIMWTMFGFSRMVQLVTHLMPQSTYCAKRSMAV